MICIGYRTKHTFPLQHGFLFPSPPPRIAPAGDESYAGASSWENLERVVKALTGMPYVLPTGPRLPSDHMGNLLLGIPKYIGH